NSQETVGRVAWATIDETTGDVSSWTMATLNGQHNFQPGVALYNGYLYVSGGLAGAAPVDTVEYAQLGSDGVPGTWTTLVSNALPGGARFGHTMVAHNGFMYITGGCTNHFLAGSCSNGTSTIETTHRAAILADGTLGAWSTSGMPNLPSNLGR